LATALSVTTTPERGASSHSVEAPVKALGRSTENDRREEPPANTTDDEGYRWRQVGNRPGESGADNGAQERHRRWSRHQPDSCSVPSPTRSPIRLDPEGRD